MLALCTIQGYVTAWARWPCSRDTTPMLRKSQRTSHKGDTVWQRESLKGVPTAPPLMPPLASEKRKQIPQELQARAEYPQDRWANPDGDGCVLVFLTGSLKGTAKPVSFPSGVVDRNSTSLTLFLFFWLENVFIMSDFFSSFLNYGKI